MKNKRKFIYKFFSSYLSHANYGGPLSWYWERDNTKLGGWIYSEDRSIPYKSSKYKYYCKPLNRYFTTSQFVKHIHRMNKLRVFW